MKASIPFITVLSALLGVGLTSIRAADSPTRPKQVRAYFTGNSVTDALNYGDFAKAVQGAGDSLAWGRQIIPEGRHCSRREPGSQRFNVAAVGNEGAKRDAEDV